MKNIILIGIVCVFSIMGFGCNSGACTVTTCCDGTCSDSTGSGACSHHDGVCDSTSSASSATSGHDGGTSYSPPPIVVNCYTANGVLVCQ